MAQKVIKKGKAEAAPKRKAAERLADGEARNIGVEVPGPKGACADPNCPFHGTLPVRGQTIDGVAASAKMERTVVVRRDYLRYSKKYQRFEKRSSRYMAHSPPCLEVKAGDGVSIMECRPLSKRVSFVIIENKGSEARR
ncbi:MAG: 30S ribosomal protein S17 [Euryarchaeota archaeon]|nr:30S ribosomal protein S17 [Euryarchaeota archaeon]